MCRRKRSRRRWSGWRPWPPERRSRSVVAGLGLLAVGEVPVHRAAQALGEVGPGLEAEGGRRPAGIDPAPQTSMWSAPASLASTQRLISAGMTWLTAGWNLSPGP